MAENVGSIYTPSRRIPSLVNGANAADRSLDSMQGSMQRTDATAGKLRQTRMTRVAGARRQANQQIGAQTRHTAG
ncbi:hypothetical protein [Pseudomonas aeruginosa]